MYVAVSNQTGRIVCLFVAQRGDKQVERLAGDRTPRPEEAHGRRAARLGLQVPK